MYETFCAIWYHLYNFKIVRSVTFKVAIKVTLFHECFLRFLNCTNSTKSRKASYMIFHKISLLMALFLQLIGLMLAYKLLEARRNVHNWCLHLRKKNIYIGRQFLCRKPKSIWVEICRAKQRRLNMIG